MRKNIPGVPAVGPLSTSLGNLGTAGIQSATCLWGPVLPWLSLAYLSHPDCLCSGLARIPAAGKKILFSRRGLINACSLRVRKEGWGEKERCHCMKGVGEKIEQWSPNDPEESSAPGSVPDRTLVARKGECPHSGIGVTA